MKVDAAVKQAIDIAAQAPISRSADAVVFRRDGVEYVAAMPYKLSDNEHLVAYVQRWDQHTVEIRSNTGSLYWRLT